MNQLITDAYKEQNRQLHERSEGYGTSGAQWRHVVREISDWGRLAILDYGCGKQTLSKTLGPAYRVTDYDPCISGLDTPPDPHPVVICGDVMEHIEPDLVDNVLADVRRLCLQRGLFVIHLQPAQKHLPDGRNAHLIVKPHHWWLQKLEDAGFKVKKHDCMKHDGREVSGWFIVE